MFPLNVPKNLPWTEYPLPCRSQTWKVNGVNKGFGALKLKIQTTETAHSYPSTQNLSV